MVSYLSKQALSEFEQALASMGVATDSLERENLDKLGGFMLALFAEDLKRTAYGKSN